MRVLLPAGRDDEVVALEPLYAPPEHRHLRVGFVQSLDGAIAVQGRSGDLGSAADRRVFQTLRAVSDGVLVGAGTARQERYGPVRLSAPGAAWRRETGRPEDVPLLIVSRTGGDGLDATRLPPTALVLTTSAGARRTGVPFERIACGAGAVDLGLALDALAERGYRRLICEGGPSLFSALLAGHLVDEVCLTIAPLLVGGLSSMLSVTADPPRRVRLVGLLGEDDVLLSRWSVDKS